MSCSETEKLSTILIISPHTKVRLNENPTEGVESRVSSIAGILAGKDREVIVLEPSDLKKEDDQGNIIREYFYAFDFIKIKNMRLGSYFLSLNPFYQSKLFKILKKYSPSIILVSQPWGLFSTWLIAKKIFGLKSFIIQDSHNVEKEYAKIISKDKSIPAFIKLFYIVTIGWIEKLALRYADCTLAISWENKRKFVEEYRVYPEKIRVLPPLINYSSYPKRRKGALKRDKSQILAVFHGIYRTVQNREAIDIIVRELVPKLKQYKNFKFIIFGKGVPKIERDNLYSLGFVENVYSTLQECDIAVVPLISGEGVKLKMLDYMVVGLPIVTTKKGAEGLGLVNGKHAIIVDDVDEEFIRAVENLIKNPKARKKLGYHANKLVKMHYNNEKVKIGNPLKGGEVL